MKHGDYYFDETLLDDPAEVVTLYGLVPSLHPVMMSGYLDETVVAWSEKPEALAELLNEGQLAIAKLDFLKEHAEVVKTDAWREWKRENED
jgi:hypothetical protein